MPDTPEIRLLERAIDAVGVSRRRFAFDVLGVDERTVRYWLSGDRTIPPTIVILAIAILRRAGIADELIAAHEVRIQGETI